jgi:hypothetical protein
VILFEERSLSQSRWKLIGASNAILVQPPPHDDLREELKRRTVPANAETAAMLFLALLASGQITMCKADGWQSLAGKPSGHIVDLAAWPDSIMLPGASSSSSSTVRGGTAKPRQKSIPFGGARGLFREPSRVQAPVTASCKVEGLPRRSCLWLRVYATTP